MTKQPDDRLAQLCKAGAVMDILDPGLSLPLGWAKVIKPGSLLWVPMWPMRMQDAHLLEFDTATVQYGRDVLFYDADGKLLAQAIPWQEAAELPAGFMDQLPSWQAYLTEGNAVKRIYSWAANNLGTTLPV